LEYFSDLNTAREFQTNFNTLAKESELWAFDAVETAMAHFNGNEVRRAYVRGEHWDERVRMADWWANELGKMKEGARNGEKGS
jgi:hypothetical protein